MQNKIFNFITSSNVLEHKTMCIQKKEFSCLKRYDKWVIRMHLIRKATIKGCVTPLPNNWGKITLCTLNTTAL